MNSCHQRYRCDDTPGVHAEVLANAQFDAAASRSLMRFSGTPIRAGLSAVCFMSWSPPASLIVALISPLTTTSTCNTRGSNLRMRQVHHGILQSPIDSATRSCR